MAYAPRISPEMRNAIIAAKEAKERVDLICTRVGVTRATVYRVWFRHKFPSGKADPALPAVVVDDVRPDVVTGLHGVSLPRLRCLEAIR